MAFDWNTERVEELKLYVAEGLSFSQIARKIGCGSRNSALCKFNRLREKDPTLQHPHSNLHDKNKYGVPKQVRVYRRPVPREKALAVILKDQADIIPLCLEDGSAVTIENISSMMCHFPIGDPYEESFRLCGQTQQKGSMYCADHHRICYLPTQPHRRKDYVAKQQA